MQIPNLGNAATSNKDLYKKKKKKKEEEKTKFKGNRFTVPNLSNAAKSNKDLYVNKNKSNDKKKKTKTKGKTLTPAQKRFKEREAKGLSGLTGGKKGETIAEYRARQKKRISTNAGKKHADWKKMRSGDMTKAAFIKKYPNSQTAKKSGVTTKRTITSNNNKKVVNKKTNKNKSYKKLNDKQFNKKFDIKKGDSKFRKYKKSGGLPGLINRRLKILKNMSAEDFRLNKKKKK
jgi:hypothetical protein